MSRPPAARPRTAALLVSTALLIACHPAASGTRGHAPAAAGQPSAPVSAPSPATDDAALPGPPYAAERAMGAQWCPDETKDGRVPARARATSFLYKPCLGLLPQHLAKVLVAIPERDIFVPAAERAALMAEPQTYMAVAGRGRRPDVFATVDFMEGIAIRSFEGRSPRNTVYLVLGPFRCIDNDPLAAPEGEYRLEMAACSSALPETRLYKWNRAGELVDVTARYLPAPALTPVEQAAVAPGSLRLSLASLTRVPVMRWTARVADRPEGDEATVPMPDDQGNDRNVSGILHAGFVRWDGRVFQRLLRVPGTQWPGTECDRARGDAHCAPAARMGLHADRFVD